MVKNLSAIKRDQIALRNNIRNKNYKSTIKTLIKKVLVEINSLNSVEDKKMNFTISEVYSKIDKAVKRRVISKNSGARKKSMISTKLKIKKNILNNYSI